MVLKKANPKLLKNVGELLNLSDREIMALSLGENEKWTENYQMAMTIKLRRTLHSLNKEVIKLRKSTNFSSCVMIILTIILVILTIKLVYYG
ncbi:hypothetical protein GOV06_01395 [Candidatus Woesearchaeota archaeon]|nr:hypothetical protein [Candidatus Woesearchaeota archaeon]